MKKIYALAVALLALLALLAGITGCGGDDNPEYGVPATDYEQYADEDGENLDEDGLILKETIPTSNRDEEE